MASPPFDINAGVPADDDIVSQFPLNERATRDIIESWITVEHNTQGRHKQVSLDWGGTPTGVASVTTIWANSVGALRFREGTGPVGFLGAPLGAVVAFGGTTEPEGWMFTYGQAISRTTYASLFSTIGTSFGAGDGSTTFNLPDLRGRVIAGQDDMGGVSANRLTSPLNGDTLGAAGGTENITLVQANLPNYNLNTASLTIASNTVVTNVTINITRDDADGTGSANPVQTVTPVLTKAAVALSGTLPSGGSGTAHTIVQPTQILNYIIKVTG